MTFLFDSDKPLYVAVDVSELIQSLIDCNIFRFCNSDLTVQLWIQILVDIINNQYEVPEDILLLFRNCNVHIDVDRDYAAVDNYLVLTQKYFDEAKLKMEQNAIIPRMYVYYRVVSSIDNGSVLLEFR